MTAGAGNHAVYALSPRAELLKPALQALYDWGLTQGRELGVEFGPLG